MKLSMLKSLTFLGVFVISVSAKADIILNIEQVGSDMVASYSGSINLDALIPENSSGIFVSALYSSPDRFGFSVGNSIANVSTQNYEMPNFVPATGIGTVPFINTPDETGDSFYFGYYATPTFNLKRMNLPAGYASGELIYGSATYSNTDLFSLAFVGGTHTFSFGQNGISESVILNIQTRSTNAVNAPSTAALAILGLIIIGNRRLKQTSKLHKFSKEKCI